MFHMHQRRDESISEYIDRFQTSRLESGSEENQNLVAAFVASLSLQHSKDVCAEVISQLGEKTKDLDSVCSLVRRICKDNKRQHEDDVQESARFVRAKPNYSAKRHRDNRARSPGAKSFSSKPCTYCKKPWSKEHRCYQYVEAKKLKNERSNAKDQLVARAASVAKSKYKKHDRNDPLTYQFGETSKNPDDAVMAEVNLEAL
ncbi:hypothetical protein DFQ28_004356, partial [Apophysomyces sp. BC1034]